MSDTKIVFNNSYLESINGIDVLCLNEKNYYDTGFSAGTLLVKSKNKAVSFFKNPFVSLLVTVGYLILKSSFKQIRIPKDYFDELRGYADATKIPYHRLFFLNFGYDVLVRWILGCSTLAFINSDGSPIVGHNTDYGKFLANLSVKYLRSIIIQVSIPGKTPFVHVGFPLSVDVLNGYNKHGLILTSNAVDGGSKNALKNILASGLLPRLILERGETLDDAENIVKENHMYTSGNLMVTSVHERTSRVFEITPEVYGITRGENNYLACTNHNRSAKMVKQYEEPKRGTKRRLSTLEKYVEGQNDVSVETMIRFLQDHRYGLKHDRMTGSVTNNGTLQSFVFDLENSDIYISNAVTLPVSLNGEYVKIHVEL